MRIHAEATELPTLGIGGVDVPRVILGNLPFLGESYQGRDKNALYVQRFSNIEVTARLLKKALGQHGLTAISAMPPNMSQLSSLFYEALKAASRESGVEAGLVACFMIPLRIRSKPVDDYRRWVTYYRIEVAKGEGVAEKYLKDPILLCREGWDEKFPMALANTSPYGEDDIGALSYDKTKLAKVLRSFEGHRVLLIEPGSETDFLAMTGRSDLLREIIDTARDHLGCPVVLGVHHAGSTIPILENSGIDLDGYVTPMNSLGALMLPQKDDALEAIRSCRRPVIAIKPMAGGRIPPAKAFQFVYEEAGADSCMIGVADEEELELDANEALRVLMRLRTSRVPEKAR